MLSIDARSTLEARIKQHTARIAVIGLGYVGLPLAMRCARAGFTVIGIDQDSARVDQVNRGEDYVADRTLHLGEIIASGRLLATHGWDLL